LEAHLLLSKKAALCLSFSYRETSYRGVGGNRQRSDRLLSQTRWHGLRHLIFCPNSASDQNWCIHPFGHCLLHRSLDAANNSLLTFAFVGFFAFSVALINMAPGPFVPVPKFFGKEPDGMIPLVASGRPPATSKAKLQFGHHVTPAIAKHHGASSLCYSADPSHLLSQLRSEALEWNPAAVNTFEFQIDRLHALRSESVGGCLGVFQHWNPVTQAFGTPVLCVVACPAIATLGRFGPDDIELPGLNLQDAWDASLSPPLSAFPDDTVSCPPWSLPVVSPVLSRIPPWPICCRKPNLSSFQTAKN
jgi:hypothetical protein